MRSKVRCIGLCVGLIVLVAALSLSTPALAKKPDGGGQDKADISIASNHEVFLVGEQIAFDVGVTLNEPIQDLQVKGFYPQPNPQCEVQLTQTGDLTYRYVTTAAGGEGERKLRVRLYGRQTPDDPVEEIAHEDKVIHVCKEKGDLVDKDITLQALQDAPDPFSAGVAGQCTISVTYAVLPKKNKTNLVRQHVALKNAAGQTVRELETSQQIDAQADTATLETQWDGKDAAGQTVPDGQYSYDVYGILYWREQTPGTTIEHILGVTSHAQGAVVLDNTKPQIADLRPEDGSATNNKRPPMNAIVTDALSGVDVDSIEVVLDNKTLDHTYDAQTGAVTCHLDADLAEAWHDLSLSANDNVGNSAHAASRFCTDYTPPVTTVSLSAPANLDGWHSDDVTLTFKPTDNLSGASETHVVVDGEEQQLDDHQLVLTEEGVHEVLYWSTDTAGNAEAEKYVPIRIDKSLLDGLVKVTRGGSPLAEQMVFADYLDNGQYANAWGITDQDGMAAISLPEADKQYEVRTQYRGVTRRARPLSPHGSIEIEIPGDIVVVVTRGDDPLADQTVWAQYQDSGEQAGPIAQTDAKGKAFFSPPDPDAQYKVLTVYRGKQYTKSPVAAGDTVTISLPAETLVKVMRGGKPLADQDVYAYFADDGQYAGVWGTTDAEGEAALLLQDEEKQYMVVTHYEGMAYGAGPVSVGGVAEIAIPGTTVQVTKGGGPLPGQSVFVYRADDMQYVAVVGPTDANGEIVFGLPDDEEQYKVRVYYNETPYTAGPITEGDTTEIAILADTLVEVTKEGEPVPGLPVEAYDLDSGEKAGVWGPTNDQGKATLSFPDGDAQYEVRVCHEQTTYRASPVSAGATVKIHIPADATVTVKVTLAGEPVAEQIVLAYYMDDGSYPAVGGTTDEQGQTVLTLPDIEAEYEVRTEYNNMVFRVVDVSAGDTALIAIPGEAGQILVQVTKGGGSLAGQNVYASFFNDGAPAASGGPTDEKGEVTLNVPYDDQMYMVYINEGGARHETGPVSAGDAAQIDIPGDTVVIVTRGDEPFSCWVYPCHINGSSAGDRVHTNAEGEAAFSLPAGEWYEMHVYHEGVTYRVRPVAAGDTAYLQIPTETVTATVEVTKAGEPLSDQWVYAHYLRGAFVSSGQTNAQGQVVLTLPYADEHYEARTEYRGTTHLKALLAGDTVEIKIPRDTSVTVTKGGSPLAGQEVYAWSGWLLTQKLAGGTTDEQGKALLSLPEGVLWCQVRTSYGGTTYSAGVYVGGAATIAIPADTLVRVKKGGEPLPNMEVYAHDLHTGAFAAWGATDADGEVVLNLPSEEATYEVSLFYYGWRLVSPVSAGDTVEIDLPVDTIVSVTRAGRPAPNVGVWANYLDGTWTGVSAVTDAYGKAVLILPDEDLQYKVSARYQGTIHSVSPVTPGEIVDIDIPADTVVKVTVEGEPLCGQQVRAKLVDGWCPVAWASTDAQGEAILSLPHPPEGEQVAYEVYTHYAGARYSASVFPGDTVEIAIGADITVKVTAEDEPVAGQLVYLFYADDVPFEVRWLASNRTGSNGEAALGVPDADKQYQVAAVFGDVIYTAGPVPSGGTIEIELACIRARVTKNEQPLAGQRVSLYYFDTTAYAGSQATTTVEGEAILPLADSTRQYLVKTTYRGRRYSAGPAAAGDTVEISIGHADTVVTVKKGDQPLPGQQVYAYFAANGLPSGSDVTNAQGKAFLPLMYPDELYHVVTSYRGLDYGVYHVHAGDTIEINIPADTLVKVTKSGAPVCEAPVRAYYYETQSYTGEYTRTDSQGEAMLWLSEADEVYLVEVEHEHTLYRASPVSAGDTVIIDLDDDLPPITTHNYEHDGEWVTEDVHITLTAVDQGGGSVAQTLYCIDDGPATEGTEVTITQDGIYVVTFWSADYMANREEKQSIEVRLDKTPPSTEVARSVAPNQYGWNNTDVTLTFTPTDNLSGVAETHLVVNDVEQEQIDPITFTEEGANKVSAWSVDEAGNEEAPTEFHVKIDKTVPQIAQIDPEDGAELAESPAEITAALTDNLSGVAPPTIEMKLDGQALDHTYDPNTGVVSHVPPQDIEDGEHTLTISIEDMAGNPQQAQSSFVVGALVPPVVDYYSPEAGFVDGGTWVEFRGDKFRGNTTVHFGEAPAQEVKFYDKGKIYAITPAHPAGVVDIVLSNGPEAETVLEDGFEYLEAFVVVIEDIEEGDVIAGSDDLTLTGTVSGGQAPYTMEVTSDGDEASTIYANIAEGQYEVTVPLTDGFHYIFVWVEDAVGHVTWTSFYYLKDTTPPNAPAQITAHIGGTDVVVVWTRSTSLDAVQYRIDMRTEPEGQAPGAWEEVEVVDAPANTLVVEELTEGQTYGFRVAAIDRVGNENPAGDSPTTTIQFLPFLDLAAVKENINRKARVLGVPIGAWDSPLGTVAELQEVRAAAHLLSGLCYSQGTTYKEAETEWTPIYYVGMGEAELRGWKDPGWHGEIPDLWRGWLPVGAHVKEEHVEELMGYVGAAAVWLKCETNEILKSASGKNTYVCFSGFSTRSFQDALDSINVTGPFVMQEYPGWSVWDAFLGASVGASYMSAQYDGDQWDIAGSIMEFSGTVEWKQLPPDAVEVFWIETGVITPGATQQVKCGTPWPLELQEVKENIVRIDPKDIAEDWGGMLYGLVYCEDMRLIQPRFFKKIKERSLTHQVTITPQSAALVLGETATFSAVADFYDGATGASEFSVPLPVEVKTGPGFVSRGTTYVATGPGVCTLTTRLGGAATVHVGGVDVVVTDTEGYTLSEADEELYGALLPLWDADLNDKMGTVEFQTFVPDTIAGTYTITVGPDIELWKDGQLFLASDGTRPALTKQQIQGEFQVKGVSITEPSLIRLSFTRAGVPGTLFSDRTNVHVLATSLGQVQAWTSGGLLLPLEHKGPTEEDEVFVILPDFFEVDRDVGLINAEALVLGSPPESYFASPHIVGAEGENIAWISNTAEITPHVLGLPKELVASEQTAEAVRQWLKDQHEWAGTVVFKGAGTATIRIQTFVMQKDPHLDLVVGRVGPAKIFKLHVFKGDLDGIDAGGTELVADSEEENPGVVIGSAWGPGGLPAHVVAHPTEDDKLKRLIVWSGPLDRIEATLAGTPIAEIGYEEDGAIVVPLPNDDAASFEVIAKGLFGIDDKVTVTMRVIDPATQGVLCSDSVVLTSAKLEVFDLRAWGPRMAEDGSAGIASTDLRAKVAEDARACGAIADGASLCLIRVLPATLTYIELSIRKKGETDVGEPHEVGSIFPADPNQLPAVPAGHRLIPGTGSLGSTTAVSANGLFFYRPPSDYLFGPNLEEQEIEFVYTELDTQICYKTFLLRRPPLILAHGFTGDPSTWSHAVWKDRGIMGTRVFRLNYKGTNTAGYDINYPKLAKFIEECLQKYRNGLIEGVSVKRYAATRADVVGHSMGGVITRFYVADLAEGHFARDDDDVWKKLINQRRDTSPNGYWNYLRDANFGAGSIRRFISTGSPFKGSPLANGVMAVLAPTDGNITLIQLLAQNPLVKMPKGLLDADGHYTQPTAVADLAEGSVAQLLLENGNYPNGHRTVWWCPIIGQASAHSTPGAFIALWNWLLIFPNAWLGTSLSILDPNTSDLVVPIDSARMGLGSNVGAVFPWHSHVPVPNPQLTALLRSQDVGAVIRDLLNWEATSTVFHPLDP